MNEGKQGRYSFVAYEYRSIIVKQGMIDLYVDCFPSFGWTLEKTSQSHTPSYSIMKFKRDRRIINKAELTRLQHEFESRINEINTLEWSKVAGAGTAAYSIGVLGTVFMTGSVFAVTSNMILLCIILAVPGFMGWILPYFCFRGISEKKAKRLTPLIDEQYEAIYAACEKANALLYK